MSRIRDDFAAEVESLAVLAARGLGTGPGGGLEVLEQVIRAAMTAVGCSLLEGLLAADPGHRGPRVACGSGHWAQFVSYRAKTVDTVLGPIRLQRAYYHCRVCRAGVVPRDVELDVSAVSLSGGLASMIATTGAAVPFAQAAGLLRDLAGITLTTKRVERATEAAGTEAAAVLDADTEAVLAGRAVPPPPVPAPEILYIAVDGTGVPMTPAETADRPGKGPDGRARTREAKLACLFTQTGLDADDRPVRDPDSTSYLATLEPVEKFSALVAAEARRRGCGQIRQLVVLGDWAHWIWNLATARFPEATQIVDLFHAREHLHELTDLLGSSSPRNRTTGTRHDGPNWTTATSHHSRRGQHVSARRSQGQRTHQGAGLLKNNAPPHALRPLPPPWHVRRFRHRRSRLQSRRRPTTQTLRHALVQPRRLPASSPCAAKTPAAATRPQPPDHHPPQNHCTTQLPTNLTHTPVRPSSPASTVWFETGWEFAKAKDGISALNLQRRLQVGLLCDRLGDAAPTTVHGRASRP